MRASTRRSSRFVEDRCHRPALARQAAPDRGCVRVSSGCDSTKSPHRAATSGCLLPQLPIEHRHGAQRQQADHGAHLEPLRAAVRQAQHVVEESVLLVPHARRRRRRRSSRRRSTGSARRTSGTSADTSAGASSARLRSRACSGRTAPSMPCRPPARDGRRSAAARCGRRRRCCRARGTRPRTRSCPARSLRFTHHVKLSSSFVERALEPVEVAAPAHRRLEPVGEDRRPRVHRRVDVAEVPLVGGQLPVRVQVRALQHQVQLRLAEILVDQRQRQDVERQVPCRVPGVFPFVGHGDDVGVVHVMPVLGCAARCAGLNGSAPCSRARSDVVVVELLRPQHARERLPHDVRRIGVRGWRDDAPHRTHRLRDGAPRARCRSPRRTVRMACGELRRRSVAQSQPQDVRLPGRDVDRVVRCRLGAAVRCRIHRLAATVHDVVVDAVLHERRAVRCIRTRRSRIGLVLGEQQLGRILAVDESLAELRMIGVDARYRAGRWRSGAASGGRRRPAQSRCYGTRASAARAASRPPVRGCTR